MTGLRFHPDVPLVSFHDFFADRESNSAARILLARVQAFENHEDIVDMLRRDPDPVVFN